MTTPSGLGLAYFTERVGDEFALELPAGGRAPMVLTECTVVGPGAFSLIFKAGPDAPNAQGTYAVSADGFGPEAIFLVPVARRPGDDNFPLEFQAIFQAVPVPDPPAHLEEEVR